jgi:hypothetical protein
MTHEDAGHYSAKHPVGMTVDPEIAAVLQESATDGRVTCAAAHDIAEDLGLPPAEVGKAMDLLELRIVACQLGLFGYSPEKKIVKPAEDVSDELRTLLDAAAPEGRITCLACWDIARALGLAKMTVSATCEHLGLKVRPCQLGAF